MKSTTKMRSVYSLRTSAHRAYIRGTNRRCASTNSESVTEIVLLLQCVHI